VCIIFKRQQQGSTRGDTGRVCGKEGKGCVRVADGKCLGDGGVQYSSVGAFQAESKYDKRSIDEVRTIEQKQER